ncbi:hypothetical protein [Vagococcus fluvialis]|uniref:hypothetical protein n=1 Tax=Vagococcus fluvialis TaxID=2738 RepID=UPI001D0ACE07|nr:hypothetical protein [Vagococcus fluvialis]UDM70673.1 hypothetical protein K5L00_11150 [Vagococcus fluvialis]UDM78092.1 hypothetical protein K5K98_06685 [Vagococcus fluvialis]UDM82361.1 hypothetical protein K5K96_13625 [Vagococcus fluvialis]
MNEYYEEYCNQVAKTFAMSMEQVNSSMMNLMQSAKLGAESLGMFKELTKDRIETVGNKRNGTQDRRQAFGGLF